MLNEALFELTLGRRALRILMFVAEVTHEYMLGLHLLWAYFASVDLGHHLLRLGREEVTLWRPGTRPKSVRLFLVGDEVIPARCERVVMARLGTPLDAIKIFIEPNQGCPLIGVSIARTLVRAEPVVPIRFMNVPEQDQVSGGGNIIGHWLPAVWAANIEDQKTELRRKRGLGPLLRELNVSVWHLNSVFLPRIRSFSATAL